MRLRSSTNVAAMSIEHSLLKNVETARLTLHDVAEQLRATSMQAKSDNLSDLGEAIGLLLRIERSIYAAHPHLKKDQ